MKTKMAIEKGSHLLFPTAIGTCGIAWSARGLVWLQLPERTAEATRARLLERSEQRAPYAAAHADPPRWVKDAVRRLTRHLEGHDEDLSSIPLDTDGVPPFFQKVYDASRAIGRGEVRTYGEIAAAAGSPGASRAVGQALAKNPIAILIPCHRVVASGRKPGGFSAPGGLDTKARLLAIEGGALPGKPRSQAR